MSEPIYRQTLRHAWHMVWHNKSFWGLGLLSALFAGSFGINNFLGQLILSMSNKGQVIIFSLPNFNFLPGNINNGYFSLIVIGTVMIAIALAVIYISVVSKTTLLIAMADYYKTKKHSPLDKLWNRSLKHFWKIFFLEIGRKFSYFIVLFIFGLIWINTNSLQSGMGIFISSLTLALAILIALVISSVTIFASGYVVIDNRKLKTSLIDGFKMFKKHFMVCLEVSILLIFLDFLLVTLIVVLLSLFFLPASLFALIAVLTSNTIFIVFGIILSLIITIIATLLIGAIYNTFYTGAWMYLFMEMHHTGILSHFRNFFKRLF